MKTIKFITIAAAMLLGLASCSDEKKALDFVSKEVMPEEKIELELTKYLAYTYGNIFINEFYRYFNLENSKFKYIILSDEFRHKYTNPRGDDYSKKSEETLKYICANGRKQMELLFDRADVNSITTVYSGEQMVNKLASLVVYVSSIQRDYNMYLDGQIHSNPEDYLRPNSENPLSIDFQSFYESMTREERDKYYNGYGLRDWDRLSEEKQQEVIDDYARWLIVTARETIKNRNYKLIDKSCTTIGEDNFEVRYLLEPHLEIVFPVRKVGKTFVSDGYRIEGNILQDPNSNI